MVSLADRLPPSQREVVRCKLLEGMDNRAVAEKLGISVTTVRVHLCRAVAKLRNLLDVKCEETGEPWGVWSPPIRGWATSRVR